MRKTTNKSGIDRCVWLLAQYGVRDWVFSPGSRNAPMAIAVRALDEARIEVIVDERSAGFTALGMAMSSRRPVVLCCTSGSAAANYLPAVVEAFYASIPLIVLTADRPEHRIDQFEGQTIRQRDLYGSHVLYSAQIDEKPSSESEFSGLDRMVFEAYHSALSGGPVHLNVPLSEPLYGTQERPEIRPVSIIRSAVRNALEPAAALECARALYSSKKVLWIVGSFPKRSERLSALLERVLLQPSFYLLSESLSNLDRPLGCPNIDRIVLTLSPEEREALRPDLVISLGGELVSRKLKLWLRETAEWDYWQLGTPLPGRVSLADPMERLSRAIPVDAELFLEQMLEYAPKEPSAVSSSYSALWSRACESRAKKSEDFLKTAEWSDLKVHHRLISSLPPETHLFEGNSSPIRYVQLCAPRHDLHHLANRGVSGIEGTTSTALGYARKVLEPVVLISGDLAFFYDSNAFWQANLPKNLKIALINNGGGGIFRIIDGPSGSGWLEEHFEWSNARSAELLCSMFSVAYFRANSEAELNSALPEWLNSEGPSVLEVFTPTLRNPEVLEAYFETLRHG